MQNWSDADGNLKGVVEEGVGAVCFLRPARNVLFTHRSCQSDGFVLPGSPVREDFFVALWSWVRPTAHVARAKEAVRTAVATARGVLESYDKRRILGGGARVVPLKLEVRFRRNRRDCERGG